MITGAALLVAAIAIPALLIALVPRRWVVLAMAAWVVSPLFLYIGVVVWEGITRPAVTFSFENALLGFSLISAILIIPWGLTCAVGFGIGFGLRRAFRANSAKAGARLPDSTAPAPLHITPASVVRTASISQPVPAAAYDASLDRAEQWRHAHIGFENDDLTIGGLGVWRHAWQRVDSPSLRLPHPAYPGQLHDFTVEEIVEGSTTVRFAAGELSNGVWGFYVLGLDSFDISSVSADRSLRYEQRHGEICAGQPGKWKAWAVLLDASTGQVLVDCAQWPQSLITSRADGTLDLWLQQDEGETLFRIHPATSTFRNQGEHGDDRPLIELAGVVEQLRRAA